MNIKIDLMNNVYFLYLYSLLFFSQFETFLFKLQCFFSTCRKTASPMRFPFHIFHIITYYERIISNTVFHHRILSWEHLHMLFNGSVQRKLRPMLLYIIWKLLLGQEKHILLIKNKKEYLFETRKPNLT